MFFLPLLGLYLTTTTKIYILHLDLSHFSNIFFHVCFFLCSFPLLGLILNFGSKFVTNLFFSSHILLKFNNEAITIARPFSLSFLVLKI